MLFVCIYCILCVTETLYTLLVLSASAYTLSSASFVRDGVVSSDFLTRTKERMIEGPNMVA